MTRKPREQRRPLVALSSSSVYPEPTSSVFEIAGHVGYDAVEIMVSIDPVSQDIDAVKHPVANTVVELDIRLNAGVLATEFVKQRHEDSGERRFRANDAQRPCDLFPGLLRLGQSPVECRESGLRVLQKTLPLLGKGEAARRPM